MEDDNNWHYRIPTKEEVELFSDKSIEEKKITCEVCVPHIFFSNLACRYGRRYNN